MRILITGITGFVGCHLARHLAKDPSVEVYGLAMHPDRCEVTVAGFFETDICDRERLRDAIKSCDPDAIVHLAGLSHVGESWKRPGDTMRVNFGGTRHLVHAAEGRRVLFASSAEVYGYVPEDDQPITEDRPVEPRSPYAMTKACAEEIARDHGAIVVRSFNSIGPGQAGHFALPSFASQLADIRAGRLEPVIQVGDLSPRRDFLHVDDAVRGYEAILRHGEDRGVYNLASGTSHSIADCLDRLRRVSGVEAEVEVDPARVRPVDIPLLQGDTSRLNALGWAPSHDLDDALHDLWHAVLDDATADA